MSNTSSKALLVLVLCVVAGSSLVSAAPKGKKGPKPAKGLGGYEIWRRETGFWWGNYTFQTGEGVPIPPTPYNPTTRQGFPYRYDQYTGFINITIVGNKFYQHNYFLYPAAPAEFCASALPPNTTNVIGTGTCGVNGYERAYEAFGARYKQTNCMVGTRGSGSFGGTFTTYTVPLDEATLIYSTITTVGVPAGGKPFLFARQVNTVPDPAGTLRYRTQQGFNQADYRLTTLSAYRELKLSGADEFVAMIKKFRQTYNIQPQDAVQGGALPMSTACLGPAPCPEPQAFTDAARYFGERIPEAMKVCK